MTDKRCPQCDVTKPLCEFYTRKSGPQSSQPMAYCKSCSNANYSQYSRNREATDPDYVAQRRAYVRAWRSIPENKRRARASRYKLTLQEYDSKIESQGGCCAICGKKAPLQVDHDHNCCDIQAGSCGRCNRGMLCGPCNSAIGRFQDDPQRLMDAAEYLLKWRVEHSV